MPKHTNPEILTLLALGEAAGDVDEHAHLAECPVCTAELEELSRMVDSARRSDPNSVLEDPPPVVWDRIQAQIAGLADAPASVTIPAPPRRARRSLAFVLVAAVALVAGLGIGFGVSRVNQSTQVADRTTHLNALPGWPGAEGLAEIKKDGQGNRTLVVSVDIPQATGDRLEVWLSDDRSLKMTSMGYLDNGAGTFPIPATMDLAASPVLDVSAEPLNDPDPSTHSGVSVVRGRVVR